MTIKRIPASSIVDRVSDELRSSIIRGTLAAGEPFSITDLSSRLGVSHIPVREALRRLESEGLIEFRPSRSAIVRPLDPDEVRGIYRLRLAFEPPLAALSCRLLRPSDLDHAESLLGVYTRPEDVDEEVMEHMEFHRTLLRPAASEWDLRMLKYLWQANERYVRFLFHPQDRMAQARLLEAHALILDAARSRSPLRMEKATRKHLEVNQSLLVRAIEEWIEAPHAAAAATV